MFLLQRNKGHFYWKHFTNPTNDHQDNRNYKTNARKGWHLTVNLAPNAWAVLFTITARTQTLLLQLIFWSVCNLIQLNTYIYVCVYYLAVQLAWSVKVATLWLCLHSQNASKYTVSFAYRSWRRCWRKRVESEEIARCNRGVANQGQIFETVCSFHIES